MGKYIKTTFKCPNCGYVLTKEDTFNFSVLVTYNSRVVLSDYLPYDGEGWGVGSIIDAYNIGTIHCGSCGAEFDEFEESQEYY